MKFRILTLLAALIEPVDSNTGYITCLGLEDSSTRGVYTYSLTD